MRILITGTAGFIGFHLARRLLDEGHQVLGIDGLTAYYDVSLKEARHAILARHPDFEAAILMLEDGEALETSAAARFKPDAIIHLAAQAGVCYSLGKSPRSYIDANVVGTFNVLEMARIHAVRHLMVASTSLIYGGNTKLPFAETDPVDAPLSLYAATKKATELMSHAYSHLHGIPTTAFRFFTVYGPWGRPDMALFKFVEAIPAGRPIDVYNSRRHAARLHLRRRPSEGHRPAAAEAPARRRGRGWRGEPGRAVAGGEHRPRRPGESDGLHRPDRALPGAQG